MENIYKQYMYSYPHKTSYQKTNHLKLSDYSIDVRTNPVGLYFHIPFCDSKCGYCNLFSIPCGNVDKMQAYIEAVKRHSHQTLSAIDLSKSEFNSLIFGGGTPLILSIKQMDELFNLAVDSYRLDLNKHFVAIETSPNQTTKKKLEYLKERHTDRISIGVQSFVQSELHILERHHSALSAEKALDLIKLYDFPLLNIDLIYGIPGQTLETLLYSANKALEYEPEEMFVYPLYQQANTRIYGKFEIERALQYEMYMQISGFLKDNGYYQISMRRFVKKKPELEMSCGFENMISLGCGGRTYLDSLHYCEPYTSDIKKCISTLDAYMTKADYFKDVSLYHLDGDEQKRRYVIKNLLHHTGIDKSEYENLFGGKIADDFKLMKEIIEKDWAYTEGDYIRLTELGMSLSDYIGPLFISRAVSGKMEKYKYDTII